MATLETNASMGLIVASPTAGSAGIVPGLLLALQEVYNYSDKYIQKALFNAGAIGYLAMRNATCCRCSRWSVRQRQVLLLPWLLLQLLNYLAEHPAMYPRSIYRTDEYAWTCL